MDVDRLAPWYRVVEYAAFGRALERCRFAFLSRLSGARRILLVGEGDGRVLEKLLTIAPGATFDVVEVSGVMAELAARSVRRDPRVRFRTEDARNATFERGAYDAAVTFFFFDCFLPEEAQAMIASVATALTPGGLWLHGDFAIPKGTWRSRHAEAWLWIMYRFFGVCSGLRVRGLPPIGRFFTDAGMQRVEAEERRWGMIVSEVFERRQLVK